MFIGFYMFPFSIIFVFLFFSLIFRILNRIGMRSIEDRGTAKSIRNAVRRKRLSTDTSRDDFEVYLYRLAARKNGRLTPAQIVVDSGLPMKEVEERMTGMVDNMHIRMEVTDEGSIYYEFPELEEQ